MRVGLSRISSHQIDVLFDDLFWKKVFISIIGDGHS